ncbi:MAG: DNA-binding protein Alba [Candidatus ainarchaeum sp.]|nr:DNA-binding protein Alba [Candidatus ainarchaeum sp.]
MVSAQGRGASGARVERGRAADGCVLVGRKGAMSYVLAVATQFRGGAREVRLKARGNMISEAVDVAEIVKRRFMPGVSAKSVRITSEDLARADGKVSRVSCIEITLSRD